MKYHLILLICLCVANYSCRQYYDAPVIPTLTSNLVVQGFINSNGATQITLSRTTLLTDTAVDFVNTALVEIEGNDNSRYPLIYSDSGRYISSDNKLLSTNKYRLHIKTQQGKNYVSDFQSPIITPAIDSISLERFNGGADIHVNSHDQENNTRYYKWNYEETWEINSDYRTWMDYRTEIHPGTGDRLFIMFFRDSVNFSYDTSMYRCWKSRKSSRIIIGTTEKLTEDRVHIPVIQYPQGAEELSVLYFVKIKQQGLSRAGFEFYEKMKKNTESLGSIFDAQPSEITGNITCLEDTAEIVIGYIDVATVTEAETFFYNDQIPDWNYNSGCAPEMIIPIYPGQDGNLALLSHVYYPRRLLTRPPTDIIFYAEKECVDCRLRGSSMKPPFWPE